MRTTKRAKFKAGDRVAIDRRDSAYHRARGLEYDFGTFIEYTRDEDGAKVLAVRIDAEPWDTVWEEEKVLSEGECK